METNKLNIYQKLLQIQIAVMGLKKDRKSGTYEYVTGTKVFDHIKPLMNQYGLLLKQEVISIENERIDYKTGIGTQYEKPKSEILTKAMMRFTWIDTETGEKDENLFGANGQNDWEKGLGSALTYAERYFMLKYFHIATDEDDIDNPDRKPEDTTKPNVVTPPAPEAPVIIPEPTTDQKVANMTGRSNPELSKLISDAVVACKSRAEVSAIWKANVELQENDKFLKLVEAKSSEFPKTQKAAA